MKTGKSLTELAAEIERQHATKKAKKPAKKAAAKTAAPVTTRPDGLRAGSKMAVMFDLALNTPGGITEKAICKELGWKRCRVTLTRTCAKVGAVLAQTKNDAGETLWSASLPPEKAAAA